MSTVQTPDPLEKYKWKNRVILVFAPDETDDMYQKQMAVLSGDSAGILERDLVIIPVTEAAKDKEKRWLEQTYKKKEGFTFILIGKDGGVKWTKHSPASLENLYGRIDSMPMRRAEMRRENN